MSKTLTAFADIGWLLCLWLIVPLAIVAVGLPLIVIVRLVIAVAERL
jgi:hypothetical protein